MKKVRYFDTLHKPHEPCLRAARELLKVLGLREAPILRWNSERQVECECSLMAMHYVESEMRRARGEDHTALGLPGSRRLRWLWGSICKLFATMKGQHESWLLRKERLAFRIEERRAVFHRRMTRIIETTAVIDEASKNAIKWAKVCLYGIMMSQFFAVPETDPEVETVNVDEEEGEIHSAADVPHLQLRSVMPG